MIARSAALIAEKQKHPERSFVFALVAIDHFENINDRYGPAAGRRVLCVLSEVLRRRFHERDVVSREAVEELAVFLCATEAVAEAALSDVFEEFSAITHYGADGAPFSATFNAGIGELEPGATVEEWRLRAERALREKKRRITSPTLVTTPMTQDVFDPRVLGPLIQLQERSGVPLIAEIRELFLSALPTRIEILRKAVESGDSRGAEQAAHAFRSAAGNLGAVRLCALCAQIEITTRSKDLEQAGRIVPELIIESERVVAALRII